MKISIFTEDTGTTREKSEVTFKDFYQGGFLAIASLADQLNEYGDVELNILSEQFGPVQGEEKVDEYLNRDQTELEYEEDGLSTLLESTTTSDVMVLLLSASKFDSLVKTNWERIVDKAKPDSIWCLGAARSSLASVDFAPLQRKGREVITYKRVGVARISNETRDELLEQIEQRQLE